MEISHHLDVSIDLDEFHAHNADEQAVTAPDSTPTPAPAAEAVALPPAGAQADSVPSAIAHQSQMAVDSKGQLDGLEGATKPQIWALKAYYISYELAILNALVKDMETTFADSKLPPAIDATLCQLQPLIDSSNKTARSLCDTTTSIVDKQGKS